MPQPSLKDMLQRSAVLPALPQSAPPGQPVYLVGGAVRDWCLGRPVIDFDFATPYDPTGLARSFARKIGGRCFFLDESRRQLRVVGPDRALTYDFAPFRAVNLEGDLALRDFTVNAMAIALNGALQAEDICDPLGGRRDLEEGRLRLCGPHSLADDPLRVLRAVRHCATLDLELEPDSASRVQRDAPLLAKVAGERVRTELGILFSCSPVGAGLDLLAKTGTGEAVFGPFSGRRDLEAASVAAAEAESRLGAAPQLVEAVSQAVPGSRDELGAGEQIKFSAFLRALAPRDLDGLLHERLRYSRGGRAALTAMVGVDPALRDELRTLECSPRGLALWLETLGGSPPLTLLFLACLGEGPAPIMAAALRVLQAWTGHHHQGRIPDLVSGRWCAAHLPQVAGASLGELLRRLRRAEIEGRVRTVEAGEKFLLEEGKKIIDK